MKPKTKLRLRKTRRSQNSAATPQEKISIVIPVLNESRTVGDIVAYALKNPLVGEVLVVDDGSHDGTPELAERAGARVITSSMLGKGASMEDGMLAAQHDIILYLDGDLHGLSEDLIEHMTAPLIMGYGDFVKARFARAAGRVTVLTAKPLLRTYFPELAHYNQPLGGIMAARRGLLKKLRFENDYGVDIGLLIDAAATKSRILEVDIGRLEHDSQTLDALGDMATQVARTIVERAAEWGRLQAAFVKETRERDRRRRAVDFTRVVNLARRADKLALIDMDGTLVAGRFAVALAAHTGRSDQLALLLDRHDINPFERTRRIAALFRGVPKQTFIEVARSLPLNPGAIELVVGLRKQGYMVGVCTDSYHIAGSIVRRRVFADFCIANLMRFRGEKALGRVTLAPAMRHKRGCKEHAFCKLNVLHHFLERLSLKPAQVLAVGDSENDICLLRAAGSSVAFQPKSPAVADAAKHVVNDSLARVLEFV
jgi:glucosyl-3-phosphoglycerate synthase